MGSVVAGSRVVVRCLAPKLTEVALPFQFQASRWYHVVITHTTGSALSSSFIRMFVDGNLEASSRFKYAKVPALQLCAVSSWRLYKTEIIVLKKESVNVCVRNKNPPDVTRNSPSYKWPQSCRKNQVSLKLQLWQHRVCTA